VHTVDGNDISNGSVSLHVTEGAFATDGTYNVSAEFSDAAGNISDTDTLTFKLDTAAPTVTLEGDQGGPVTTATQTIYGTAADAGDLITLTDNGSPLNATINFGSGGQWSANVTLSTDGVHHIVAHETDAAGNIGDSGEVVFTLDTAAPFTNGGFETGNLSGWQTSGFTGQESVRTVEPHGGSYEFTIGTLGADSTTSQHIATIAGHTYQVQFWLANGFADQRAYDFTASFAGQTLLTLNHSGVQDYTLYSYTVTATGSASDLAFTARNDGGAWELDDVSVTDVTPNAPPSITGDLSVTLVKGGNVPLASTTLTTAADLQATDPDTAPDHLVFSVTGTSHGHLVNTGSATPNAAITSFTQDDIDHHLISFVTDNAVYVGQGGFSVTLTDGTAPPIPMIVGVTIVDAQITVLTADGFDFNQDNTIATMGAGQIASGYSATTFTIVNTAANRDFIVTGTGFDVSGSTPVDTGTITSIVEVTHDTQTPVARLDLNVSAPLWYAAVVADALGNHSLIETLTGSWTFNFIGGAGNDGYSAGSFNDYFTGRAGDDLLEGDFGYDRANYGAATGAINVQLAAGTVDGDGSVGHDTLRSIELVTGSNFADTFNATGFSTASANSGSAVTNNTLGQFNEFEGRGGDDIITGNGQTRVSYYHATSGVTVTLTEGSWSVTNPSGAGGEAWGDASVGHDTFTGGINQIRGSNFADTFNGTTNPAGTAENFEGMGGNDTINGGGGFDRANYSQSASSINVSLAAGTVIGGPDTGTDTLHSVEAIWGTDYNDTYDATGFSPSSANAGSTQNSSADSTPSNFNEFEGGGGNDLITGNGNTRIAFYHATGGVVVRLGDNASVHGSAVGNSTGTDDIVAGVSRVRGSEFNDVITGNGTGNTLEGQGGNDVLSGGTADHASDILTGGTGADTFVYERDDANDVISDFRHSEGDRIDLRSFTTIHSFSDLVIALSSANGDPNSTRITSSVTNAFDSAANDRILLQGVDHTTLQASDFIFAGEVSVTVQTADGYDFGTLYNDLAASNPFQTANNSTHVFAVDSAKGITFEMIGTGFTYSGGQITAGTITEIDILDTTNTLLTTQDHVLVSTNGWNISATSFLNAVGAYAADHTQTSGLDAIFNAATYSVVGSAGGSTPNGDFGSGTDVLFGGDHADVFNGLQGSFGADTVDYSHATSGVTASLANSGSNLGAAAAGDTYIGIENLRGTGLIDALIGDGNDNVLEGGADADSLQGGGGSDTASYEHAATGVTASLAVPTDNTGDAHGDTYTSIENLRGSAFNDTLTGDGNDNVLEGGAGDDAINGGAGNNTASYQHAASAVNVDLTVSGPQNTVGAGTDTLVNIQNLAGSQFADRLTGDGNNNVFIGFGGNDTFVFKSNFGHDAIADFTSGQDHIEFDFDPTGGSGTLATWLASHAQASQSNAGDTVITLDDTAHSSILLKNVAIANVHASDFVVHP
jgi:hypothetical protein